jgi:hypothetical protein
MFILTVWTLFLLLYISKCLFCHYAGKIVLEIQNDEIGGDWANTAQKYHNALYVFYGIWLNRWLTAFINKEN